MTGWLIYDEKQYHINRWFADEILRYCSGFCDMRLILTEKLIFGTGNEPVRYENVPQDLPDFAVVRTIFPLLSYYLEQNGVRLFNRFSVSALCNDKRLTYTVTAKAGLPIMDTAFHDKRFLAENHVGTASFPCVVKSASGHGGKEVFLCHNRNEYENALENIPVNEFLVQKVCPTVGKDLRVYLLGGKILAAVLRTGTGFRSNFSLGGRAERYQLNKEEADSVYRVLSSLPVLPDFVGIDFLPDRERLVFNEIEDVVGCRMLYDTTDINVAAVYAAYIRDTLDKRFWHGKQMGKCGVVR